MTLVLNSPGSLLKSWNLLGSDADGSFLASNRHVSTAENSHNCCRQVRQVLENALGSWKVLKFFFVTKRVGTLCVMCLLITFHFGFVNCRINAVSWLDGLKQNGQRCLNQAQFH